MNNKYNGKGILKTYLMWPMIVAMYFIVVVIIIYFIFPKIAIFFAFFVLLYIIFAIYLQMYKYNNLYSAIQKAVINEAKSHGLYYSKIDLPHVVISNDGRILWGNDVFLNLHKNLQVGRNIKETFPEIKSSILKNLKDEKISLLTSCGDKKFKADMKMIDLKDMEDENMRKVFSENDKVVLVYLYDETDFYHLKQEFDDNKQVTGFIYIDNYDEVAENMEDSKASMLIAVVDRKLTRYISYNSGIIKKLEKDKYFFVTTKKDIDDMIEDRFSILEQTKEILGENNIPLTLSIGVGYDGKSIETNHDLARVAMDMALGRGGDQAVVKKGQETMFFGGKSASNSSSARVRARVKATSFRDALDSTDKVLIMGHKNGDFDSFGASIGVYVMAKHLGKEVHIITNSLTNVVTEIKKKFENSGAYEKNMFIDGDTALNLVDKNTLLVIVDHNLLSMSDEPRLHNEGCNVIIFDHHRLSENSLKDAVLTYLDPGASSTCELVTEIMLYFDDRLKLKSLESETLLGGIIVDTMYFTYQTTSKTFDAASYLKKKGADSDKVRKLLRLDFNSEKIKNEAINSAEFYKDGYAIAVLDDIEGIEQNVLKAEIANSLINVQGIKASIVIAYDNNVYNISSRSIDDINVQVLMEKIGGGGHRNSAGATIYANSFIEAIDIIKQTIDQYENEEVK